MSEYQLMTEDQRDMVKLVKDFLMKEYLPPWLCNAGQKY